MNLYMKSDLLVHVLARKKIYIIYNFMKISIKNGKLI